MRKRLSERDMHTTSAGLCRRFIIRLTSVLGWISASYTCSLFNIPSSTGAQLALAGAFLVAGFAVNSLSPKLAGRFQVSATFIKLIPLVLMGVVGLIVGLVNGKTIDAFKANIVTEGLVNDGGFLRA